LAQVNQPPIAEQTAPKRRVGGVKKSTVLKLMVTVALTAFVLSRADLAALVQTFQEADWGWVALALGVSALAMVINTARWQIMLRGQDAAVPLASLVRLYLVGMFFNNILPSRLGGDVVRAYGAAQMGTSKTRSAAAVLMDRLIGAISVLTIGMAAILLDASRLPDIYLQLTAGTFLFGLVMLGLMLYRNDRLSATRRRLLGLTDLSILGFKIRPRLEAAVDALRSYSRRPGLVVQAFAISTLANGLSMLNLYLYARAVRADVGLGDVATIAPFILAVGLLPISINGLGTIELTFVVLFGALGVDEHLAIAIAILRRLSLLVLSLLGGVLYALRKFS
jgi:uncharacterized protein (TIRG00374 family)